MKRAIEIASYAKENVYPNPKVGAVIVKDNSIISEGYHELYGSNHAEINALNKYDGNLNGATLYVTLEPCNHIGKTPPCTNIIKNKLTIKKLYVENLVSPSNNMLTTNDKAKNDAALYFP